jgi:hypothetical protein
MRLCPPLYYRLIPADTANCVAQDHSLGKITAVAVNPGNPADSRALRVNAPPLLTVLSMLVIIVK